MLLAAVGKAMHDEKFLYNGKANLNLVDSESD